MDLLPLATLAIKAMPLPATQREKGQREGRVGVIIALFGNGRMNRGLRQCQAARTEVKLGEICPCYFIMKKGIFLY